MTATCCSAAALGPRVRNLRSSQFECLDGADRVLMGRTTAFGREAVPRRVVGARHVARPAGKPDEGHDRCPRPYCEYAQSC